MLRDTGITLGCHLLRVKKAQGSGQQASYVLTICTNTTKPTFAHHMLQQGTYPGMYHGDSALLCVGVVLLLVFLLYWQGIIANTSVLLLVPLLCWRGIRSTCPDNYETSLFPFRSLLLRPVHE